MIISNGVFFFHFPKILNFWAKNGVKEQNWTKIGKKLVRTLSEEQHMIWLRFLVYLWFLVFLVRLRYLFIFRKFYFWGKNEIKGQTLAKNAVGIIFKELCIKWLWFLGCRCKMMIYPGDFFLFLEILIFWIKNWVKGSNGPKWLVMLSTSYFAN